MRSEVTRLRAPADSPVFRPPTSQTNAITAKEFLARINGRVDEMEEDRKRIAQETGETDVLAYLKREHPQPAPARTVPAALPARFKREPDIFLGNVRFGRTRLFLSRFIGDLAWGGVRR